MHHLNPLSWFYKQDEIIIKEHDIIKQGWLLKQSKSLKEWRRRWFILTSTHLLSYVSQENFSNPTELLDLRQCTTIRSTDEVPVENAFRVDSPDRTFFLVAETSDSRESWLGHIGRRMIRPSAQNHDDDTEYY